MSEKKRLLGHRQQRYKSNAENPIEINPDQNSATYSQHIDANVIVEKDDNQEDAGKATSADSQSSEKEVHVEKDDNQEIAGKTAPEINQLDAVQIQIASSSNEQNAVQIQIVPADNQQIIVQNAPRNNQQDEDRNAPRNNPQDETENAPRNNPQDETEKNDILKEADFKTEAVDLAHFEVKRSKRCCTKCDYTHHFLTMNKTEDGVTIVQYTDSLCGGFFGIGEVKAERYKFEDENLKQYVDIGNLKVVRYGTPTPDLKKEQFRRVLHKIGERYYDIQDYNCEHFVKYVLTGTYSAPLSDTLTNLGFCANLFISSLKSFSLIMTLIISFVGVTLSSVVRQSYVRILVALIISFKRQEKYEICESTVGQTIIGFAKQRIEVEQKILHNYDENAIKNITSFFNTDLVCDKAEALGDEIFYKSIFFMLITWSLLQTAFIFAYNFIHLKPVRLICIQRRKLYLYRKYLYKEIFGGYIPILISYVAVWLLQYHIGGFSIMPLFFFVILIAWIIRLAVIFVIEICFRNSHRRFDTCASVIIMVVLFLAYSICIVLHYADPENNDPF